jgi:hypothetical protein
LKSSTFTAGAGSLALSVLGLLAPLLAGAVVVCVLVVLARRLVRLLRERPREAER